LIGEEIALSIEEHFSVDQHEILGPAKTYQAAIDIILHEKPEVALLDIALGEDVDAGIRLAQYLNRSYPIPIVFLSGLPRRLGFNLAKYLMPFDFIPKPPDLNRLLLTLRNALDKSSLVTETKKLKKKLNKTYDIIGESAPLMEVKAMIEKVGPTDARVLITGENGSGKELVARWLHDKSARADAPFIEVNCAAIPSELIESELFGHEKGSFTSAVKQRQGKFEQASGGTLFLDEIGDMSLSAQAKVLRALQEHTITRVGGDKDIKVDVRVLAATNKDLKKEIAEGNFREDLYHRISVILIPVPPLKDRSDDIPLLVDKFLEDIAGEYGTSRKEIDQEALQKLQEFPWTGNIRELRNVIERLVILGGKSISAEDIKKYADY
jgi:DNA-binding NtrC family response regulator